jgi:flagellar hook-associated protein 1 FlgK
MSTLGSVMNAAMRSITANQYALAVSSNNVANANNPDFSRQRLLMRPAGPDGGPWGIGMGVEVTGVEALRDYLLEARDRDALSITDQYGALPMQISRTVMVETQVPGSEIFSGPVNIFEAMSNLVAAIEGQDQDGIDAQVGKALANSPSARMDCRLRSP